MIDSLFDKNTTKKFDSLAKKQAILNEKKIKVAKDSMRELSADTINQVFDVIQKYGHPDEKKLSNEIKAKYDLGQALEFDDLMNLNDLYKSNVPHFANKGAKK